jgi:serine/threonine-protein kinase HipA
MAQMFGLRKPEADREVAAVVAVVNGWQEHFSRCGVRARDIELYAEQIDRPFLKDQRDALQPRSRRGRR